MNDMFNECFNIWFYIMTLFEDWRKNWIHFFNIGKRTTLSQTNNIDCLITQMILSPELTDYPRYTKFNFPLRIIAYQFKKIYQRLIAFFIFLLNFYIRSSILVFPKVRAISIIVLTCLIVSRVFGLMNIMIWSFWMLSRSRTYQLT